MKAAQPILIISLLIVSALRVCADSNSAALARLRQIPAPAVYSPGDNNNAKIPLLRLTAQGASINNGDFIPFDQVLIALAALPKSAWLEGRRILYYDSPVGLSSDAPPPASAIKQVKEALKAAAIEFIDGGSA